MSGQTFVAMPKSAPEPARDDEQAVAAPAATPRTPLDKKLETAQDGFLWVSAAATTLVGTLMAEIDADDPPSWVESLLLAALSAGLGAATAGVSQGLIGSYQSQLQAAGKQELSEGGSEALKVSIENGLNAGIGGAASVLSANKSKGSVVAFVAAQQTAIQNAYQKAQTTFIESGRDKITSLEEAQALADTMRGAGKEAAARAHVQATRDAWVSYLAQQSFGAVEDSRGNKTTDMSEEELRVRDAIQDGRGVPQSGEPSTSTVRDGGNGVLAVRAKLPAINLTHMDGKPVVDMAFLTGVNEAVRSAYEKMPLSQVHIPRKIEAFVDGTGDNFEVSVDEKGSIGEFPGREQMSWLVARSAVGRPQALADNEFQRAFDGLHLLLQDLVANDIMGFK